jgi:hypothetical protein
MENQRHCTYRPYAAMHHKVFESPFSTRPPGTDNRAHCEACWFTRSAAHLPAGAPTRSPFLAAPTSRAPALARCEAKEASESALDSPAGVCEAMKSQLATKTANSTSMPLAASSKRL